MCPSCSRASAWRAPQPSEDEDSPEQPPSPGHQPPQGHTVPPSRPRSTRSVWLVAVPSLAGAAGAAGAGASGGAASLPRHHPALAQRIHHLLNQSTHSAPPFVINYANQHTITLR